MTKSNEGGQHEQVSFIEGDGIFPLPTYITYPRLEALADDAFAATERAVAAIDDALDFVAASNARVSELEKAKGERS